MNTPFSLEQVAQNIHTMWSLVDRRRGSETVAFCAPDFEMSAVGMTFDRSTYESMMRGREAAPYNTRHVVSNLRCVEADDASMKVAFLTTVHRLDDGQDFATISIGDVEEEWVLVDGAPAIRRRAITIAFDGRPADQRGL